MKSIKKVSKILVFALIASQAQANESSKLFDRVKNNTIIKKVLSTFTEEKTAEAVSAGAEKTTEAVDTGIEAVKKGSEKTTESAKSVLERFKNFEYKKTAEKAWAWIVKTVGSGKDSSVVIYAKENPKTAIGIAVATGVGVVSFVAYKLYKRAHFKKRQERHCGQNLS